MGTRWRGLLAPIDTPTGDGRRFLEFTNRTLPLPHRWQREDEMGHDRSVVVGLTDATAVLTVKDAIAGGWISEEVVTAAKLDPGMEAFWGMGEFFDDVNSAEMPRLAEDVAEAMLLAGKGVIGPSVGPGAVEFFGLVHPGTKDLITEEEYMEAFESGVPIEEEALFTGYEVAESTLVPVPAFSETSPPFEILTEEATITAAARPDVPAPAKAALVAAAAAVPVAVPADVFDAPDMPDYQPLTIEDRGEGFLRVGGYVAAFGTCHTEFRNACYTAPPSQMDYVPFNRYPVDTVDATTGKLSMVAAGRLTTGLGRVGTGCACCRGKDDHACSQFTLGRTIAHYDGLRTLAWVRATEIPGRGIWLAGYAPADLDPEEMATLSRRRVSGDWRDHGGHLELVEALALAKAREGFPIPTGSGFRNGRQMSLTAAGAIRPERPPTVTTLDYAKIGDAVVDSLTRRGIITLTAPVLTAADGDEEPVHTGAMVALRMTDDVAAQLAVDGGEPAGELHLTLAFLGKAADIPEDTQTAIIDAMNAVAGQLTDGVAGRTFAVSAFNPNTDEQETAIVAGVNGEGVAAAHTAVIEALAGAFPEMPAQYEPFAAHITLVYSDDLSLVEQLADRTDIDVPFDRLRVAFAGTAVDIPLAAPAPADQPEDAASLAAQVEEAFASVDAHDRARTAARLRAEVEEVANV
jgi:2'-5' RNA ligase